MINNLKEYFDTNKCTGIKINDSSGYIVNLPSVKLRFCEAVNYSYNIPLLINNQNLGCRGAERNLGFLKDDDEDLGLHIFKNTGISNKLIRKSYRVHNYSPWKMHTGYLLTNLIRYPMAFRIQKAVLS